MSVFELSNAKRRALETVDRYIESLVAVLLKPKRTTPLTLANRAMWPAKAGVYALYQGKKLVWVGESGDLSGRARDLFRTKNHSFRRLLGAKLFSKWPDFEAATTNRSFSPEIEARLTEFMERKLSFLVVPMTVGRKEVEERACARTEGLLNVRKQRGT